MQHRTLSLCIILLASNACVDEKTIGEDTDQTSDWNQGTHSTVGGAKSASGGAAAALGGEASVGGSPATGGSTGDPMTSCTATIAEAQAVWGAPCPDTYSVAQTWADGCPNYIRSYASGLCNGVPTVTVHWGTHLKSCYYDPNAMTLVGVIAKDDQPSFCGHRFYEMVAGSFPEGNDDTMGDPSASHCHAPSSFVTCPALNG